MKSFMKTVLRFFLKSNKISSLFNIILKDSFVYFIGSSLIGLGNFILVPLYTRYLNTSEFGSWALIENIILISIITCQLGLGITYFKWFAKEGVEKRGELLGTSLFIIVVSSTIQVIIIYFIVISDWGQKYFNVNTQIFSWTLFLIIPIETLQVIILNDLRAQRKSIKYVIASIIRFIGVICFSLLFIVFYKFKIYGVLLGRVSGDFIFVLFVLLNDFQFFELKIRKKLIKPLMVYGLPLVWMSLVTLLLNSTGRFFLGLYSTLENVAFYSFSYKLSNVINILFLQPFSTTFGAIYFQIYYQKNAKEKFKNILSNAFLIASFLAATLILFSIQLINILGGKPYLITLKYFPILVLLQSLRIIEMWTAIPLYLKDKTYWFSIIYTFIILVNIILNRILVPIYDIWGAIIAWFLSYSFIIIFQRIIGMKFFLIPISNKKIILGFSIWGLSILILNLFI